MPAPPSRDRYLVKSLVHALDVLAVFRSGGEILRLRDVVSRSGLPKAMCFRLLYTLHSCGVVEKVGQNQYRTLTGLRPHPRFRIGYAAQEQDTSFAREVGASLSQAAAASQVEIIMLDNRYNAKVALRNADRLVRERVDLAIEFQADEAVAPAITAKFLEASIPVIAIDIPHPGATYFGANNYEAGLIGGRHLGRWANKHWDGIADELLMLEISRAGSVPQARIRGMLAGLHETLRGAEQARTWHVDGDGQFRASLEVVRRHLRTSRARRILVGAATDPSALGALRAFDEAGRATDCAVVGHNAEPDGRAELRQPRTRLIGSVGYFPEKYGPGILRLALDILGGKATPPAAFIKHHLITPENIDHYYPNDVLMHPVRK